jgi:hypothetical protein
MALFVGDFDQEFCHDALSASKPGG